MQLQLFLIPGFAILSAVACASDQDTPTLEIQASETFHISGALSGGATIEIAYPDGLRHTATTVPSYFELDGVGASVQLGYEIPYVGGVFRLPFVQAAPR